MVDAELVAIQDKVPSTEWLNKMRFKQQPFKYLMSSFTLPSIYPDWLNSSDMPFIFSAWANALFATTYYRNSFNSGFRSMFLSSAEPVSVRFDTMWHCAWHPQSVDVIETCSRLSLDQWTILCHYARYHHASCKMMKLYQKHLIKLSNTSNLSIYSIVYMIFVLICQREREEWKKKTQFFSAPSRSSAVLVLLLLVWERIHHGKLTWAYYTSNTRTE